jgi:tetratricopeptide (TPR) repeat protein
MPEHGYVYVLINPSLGKLVKVGKTTKDPEKRAEELSSATGVPTKFIVAYQEYFSDCAAVEQYMHTILAHKGYRITENREFFEAPLSEVVKIISHIPASIATKEQIVSENDENSLSKNHDNQKLISALQQKAWDYKMGWSGKFQDYTEALKLFKQAAKLGSADAYHDIARMYEIGYGVNKDINLALKYYEEAVNRGHKDSYSNIAEIYLNKIRHYENAKKALKFFIDFQLTSKLNSGYCDKAYNTTSYYDKDFNSDWITAANPHTAFTYGLCWVSTYGFFKVAVIQVASLLKSFEKKKTINVSDIEIDPLRKKDAINALNQLLYQYTDKENQMRKHRENVIKEINEKYGVNFSEGNICDVDVDKDIRIILNFLTDGCPEAV